MNDRGDIELLREYARDGSHGAFGELVSRYAGLVYSSALRHVREGHAAEDVAQAAFIVLARRASTLNDDCVLGGWLLAVTRHTARDYLKMERRRKKREQAVAAEKDRQGGGDNGAGKSAPDSTLDDALSRLSGGNRDVIVLRFLQEKTFGEISALLGITEDSARQRAFRALEKLRTIMSRKTGTELSAQSLGAMLAVAATTATPEGLVVRLTTTALNGGTAAGASAALAKGAVTVMAYAKAKAVAVGALALLLVGGGAASIGYYVLHGDEPSPVARPDPRAPAAQNAIPNFGYNWGVAGPPQTRPVYQGPPVVGMVVDANGKSVAGATVTYGWDRVYASLIINPVNPGGAYARTGPDGRFQFVPRNGKPESIAVQADEGIGMARASELPNTPIRLTPWGHIQGMAKVGKNPAANARVSLRFSTRNDGPLVAASTSTQTDADGRFSFDKAPPGPVDLDVSLPNGQRSIVRAHVDVQSGSTATVAMGGSGRPVIGRVNPMPAGSAGSASLMLAPPRPPRPPASLLPPASMPTSMPAEERQKMIAAYRDSPEYQAYLKEREAFTKRYGNQISQSSQATVAPDGTFRLEDVPPGAYQLNVTLFDPNPGSMGRIDTIGYANQPVTVAEMPGGRSDEPLDVGELKLVIQKRLEIGKPAPQLAGTAADGKPVTLSDFRGKYVLLAVTRYKSPGGSPDMNNCVAIRDHYRDDPRLVFVSFTSRTGGVITPAPGQQTVDRLDWFKVEMPGQFPQEFSTYSESILLIDPQGKVLAKNLSAPAAVAKIEEALGPPADASPPKAKVSIAHLPPGTPDGTPFGGVPPVSATDAATNATFSVVDGPGVEPSNAADRLKDGRDATGDDAPSQNFFFELGTMEGRLKLDLGRTMSVAQINTYSRHKTDRAPQVYILYASDGTGAGFNPSPKLGTDPASVGWTKIASVDTRPKTGPVGGRYAVGITSPSGSLGRYRYLLFEIYPSETRDPYGQGFYSEIDVLEAK